MAENKRNQDTNPGQQGNQDWDDTNDKQKSDSGKPNPERYADANLGQGSSSQGQQTQRSGDESSEEERSSGGSAFNERHQSTVGAGTSQRAGSDNAGPLDSDLADLPSEKRSANQSGPGLG